MPHGSRRSRWRTASTARVARATKRTAAAAGASSARLTRRATYSPANPSLPLLAALSLSLFLSHGSVSAPSWPCRALEGRGRSHPGPGGRDEAPLSLFVIVGQRRLHLCQGGNRNTSWGTDIHRSLSPPNASLGCVAWLKSGERLVPQPGDALHHGEPAWTEK